MLIEALILFLVLITHSYPEIGKKFSGKEEVVFKHIEVYILMSLAVSVLNLFLRIELLKGLFWKTLLFWIAGFALIMVLFIIASISQ